MQGTRGGADHKASEPQKMSGRRVRRVLHNLRRQPQGRPLRASSQWLVDSGQGAFDFETNVLEGSALAPSQLPSADNVDVGPDDADAWFRVGCECEGSKPAQAREAYGRALAIDSSHPDAHINLGRLLHESGELSEAESHYRCALNARPNDVTAEFNLGVVLDDQGKLHQAVIAYRQAIACDPTCADAHFNLAQLYERLGRRADAIRHLKACRGLTITS